MDRKHDGLAYDFPRHEPGHHHAGAPENGGGVGQMRQVLYDHVVGQVTFQMATPAMEMRRLGIARKTDVRGAQSLDAAMAQRVHAPVPRATSWRQRRRTSARAPRAHVLQDHHWGLGCRGDWSLQLKPGLQRKQRRRYCSRLTKFPKQEMKRPWDRNIIRDMEKIRPTEAK